MASRTTRDFGTRWSRALPNAAREVAREPDYSARDLLLTWGSGAASEVCLREWSRLNSATTYISVEGARRFERSRVAAGASFANQIPYGDSYLPLASEIGPHSERLTEPDLAYDRVDEARHQPDGKRTGWSVTLGVRR
jgi:hypothetical protein